MPQAEVNETEEVGSKSNFDEGARRRKEGRQAWTGEPRG